ncbi:arginine--tRNA ligase [Candidatus Saccharibacteria bacterium]|nr:arginine--tRNA ligase [Candidatus Saccharibacteria bacterium]
MQELKDQLKKLIQDLYGLDFEPDLTPSPDSIDADYSSNAPMKLAKDLRRSPMQIAEELSDAYVSACDNGSKLASEQKLIITSPGFLNFILSEEFLQNSINKLDDNFESDRYKGQTVICEFSDPNPFKVLHVGHLYTSVVGDSIARLFEYAGAKVIRANFGGDVGLHVAKTMYALQKKPIEELTIEDIARCYIEGTAAYEDDETAKQEITKLNKEIYQINATGEPKKILSKSIFDDGVNTERPNSVTTEARERSEKESFSAPTLSELYWKGRELSYQYFDHFYHSIGVHFDKYYPESTVADLGLEKVKEQLEKGVYEYSDGAVIFNGDKYGLHTRVFINKEGVPTYETKDVGLIFTKWQDYHFDKSVVITGSEQLDYMKVVLKSIEQYAPELVEKTTHLTHGLVKLTGGVKMSSRKGNFLKAIDVLNMVRSELANEYHSTDEIISLAATKYAFLKYKMGGDIIFDPKESVKMTGNSGPYLLYSAVRAKKILAKSSINDERKQSSSQVRITISERNLIKKLLEYHTILDEAVVEMAPHKVANYLYELAQAFSRFYEHCEVIGSEQEPERIRLVEKYLNVMTHGLNILGIKIPEEM